jgi:predicted ATPase
MYELALKDFRGFRDLDFVEIRPITILVGENSAGKSSFIAGLKYIIDFIAGNDEPSFNKDPFQLGTFQQVSHYRGGKAGRAREFHLKLRNRVTRRVESERPESRLVYCDVSFENAESQAVISAISIGFEHERLQVKIENEQPLISYISEARETFSIRAADSFPRFPRSEFTKYWPFLLRDLRFRVRRKLDSEQESLFPPNVERRTALLAEYADLFSSSMSSTILATSPIRTKPLRTYTPGLEARDAEGSHVPYEMAKLYRAKNKEAWRKLKESLEAFGNASDMFGEVTIKSFGQTASDPFQIQFSHDGPRTNIVDLGYGTSQILPIIYDISVTPKRSKLLIQQPEVHLHPRAQSSLGSYIVDTYKRDSKQFLIETHSDFIVDRIRNAILRNIITPNEVSILFFERRKLETIVKRIELDENGIPLNPPDSYRQFFIDEQLKVLGL